jgi:hypothetical protein
MVDILWGAPLLVFPRQGQELLGLAFFTSGDAGFDNFRVSVPVVKDEKPTHLLYVCC